MLSTRLIQFLACTYLWILSEVSMVRAVKVACDDVEYIGVQNITSGINTFWGIRYAQAPKAELRWRAPVPVTYNSSFITSINASVPGNSCLQSSPPWSTPSTLIEQQDEDCLLLNVQTPINPSSTSLPIMVLIHGGGYTGGSASTTAGDSLIHQSNGSMIFVQIQYRLGPLGFLAGGEIVESGVPNAGLLDQRMALDWVQKNIHYFGGDPSKVTITGGSAGGGSVLMQLVMYSGLQRVPFRGAIPEYPWLTPLYDDEFVEEQYSSFLEAGNCSSLNCMRTLSVTEIQLATDAAYKAAYLSNKFAYGTFYWGPTIDGFIIRDHPVEELRHNHFAKVPIMIDHNGDEGLLFSNASITTDMEAQTDLADLWPDENEFYSNIALSLYPTSSFNNTHYDNLEVVAFLKAAGAPTQAYSDAFARRSAAFGDALVNCPTAYVAEAYADLNLPVYKMLFNAGHQLHGATSGFLFSNYTDADGALQIEGLNMPGNATLAKIMRDYFISFTVDQLAVGSTQLKSPNWATYTRNSPQILSVQPSELGMIKDTDQNMRCQFLKMGRGNNAGVWPQW